MQIKFTLLEREIIGIGVYKTVYETNVDVKSNPAIAMLRDQISEKIFTELGIKPDAAETDDALSLSLTVPMSSQLGMRVPSSNYMLVITEKKSITRLPESFRLQCS